MSGAELCVLIDLPQSIVMPIIVSWSLCSWNKYRSMWSFDKMAICERFVNKGLPLIRLDEKFLFYMQVIAQLEHHKPYHDVRAIR